MKCVVCKNGSTSGGTTTVVLERGATTLVFKDVPAQVCGNCGEAYVDDTVSRRLLRQAEAAVASGVEVEVQRLPAA